MPVICADKLSLEIEGNPVFKELSFTWEEKRIGVIGRNGSGKSSLVRLIAGLIAPTSGEISIDAHNLFEDRECALEKVGIVFQNPDHQIIFPTVLEEIAFGFSQKGASKEKAEQTALEVLKKYHKENWRDRVIATLSQGQRHFLALISIIEMKPELVLLDEPFTGLDIPSVTRLQNLLNDQEISILHITHEPALIADYERVIWLEEGRIEADGDAKTVIEEYKKAMKKIGESDAYTGF